MLHSIIFTVLARAQTNDKRQYSLAMVDLALHIIQLGLIECNQITTKFFSLTEKKAGEVSILSLVSTLNSLNLLCGALGFSTSSDSVLLPDFCGLPLFVGISFTHVSSSRFLFVLRFWRFISLLLTCLW